MLTRTFAQRISQRGDVARDVSFFNRRVGPYEFHHLIFAENVPAVLYKDEQNVEDLWSQWHEFAVPKQPPLAPVHAKRTKLVRRVCLPEHIQLAVFTVLFPKPFRTLEGLFVDLRVSLAATRAGDLLNQEKPRSFYLEGHGPSKRIWTE